MEKTKEEYNSVLQRRKEAFKYETMGEFYEDAVVD